MNIFRTLICTTLLLAGLLFSSFSSHVFSEEIIIGIGQQGSDTLKSSLPKRGSTQSSVATEFGEPNSKSGPTGQPPIETWQYDHFSVYFEGDYVIHSVLKHIRKD